jgi:2,4-dienoyl-CoA reductase-like NADH-dependent reductase (Old Yellow Enzyme family)
MTMTDNQFENKFNSMRGALLLDLRDAQTGFDPDLVLRAFAAHLQEISPMHDCPRWQIIKSARGWSVFLKNFISDHDKLDRAIYNSDPDLIEFLKEVAAEHAEWVASCAEKKKQEDQEKKSQGRYALAEANGFICE